MVFRQCFRLGDGNIFFAHVSLVLLWAEALDAFPYFVTLGVCVIDVFARSTPIDTIARKVQSNSRNMSDDNELPSFVSDERDYSHKKGLRFQ